MLESFWDPFCEHIDSAMDLSVTEVIDVLDDVLGPHLFPASEPSKDGASDPRACPACGTGRLGLKLSRQVTAWPRMPAVFLLEAAGVFFSVLKSLALSQGGFIGCSNYGKEGINCKYVRQLGVAEGLESATGKGQLTAEGNHDAACLQGWAEDVITLCAQAISSSGSIRRPSNQSQSEPVRTAHTCTWMDSGKCLGRHFGFCHP